VTKAESEKGALTFSLEAKPRERQWRVHRLHPVSRSSTKQRLCRPTTLTGDHASADPNASPSSTMAGTGSPCFAAAMARFSTSARCSNRSDDRSPKGACPHLKLLGQERSDHTQVDVRAFLPAARSRGAPVLAEVVRQHGEEVEAELLVGVLRPTTRVPALPLLPHERSEVLDAAHAAHPPPRLRLVTSVVGCLGAHHSPPTC